MLASALALGINYFIESKRQNRLAISWLTSYEDKNSNNNNFFEKKTLEICLLKMFNTK